MQANGVVEELCGMWIQKYFTSSKTQHWWIMQIYIICMIKNVYFSYNYSINCWDRIDPEAQKCKQETKTIWRLALM